jgi:hypothetical protein
MMAEKKDGSPHDSLKVQHYDSFEDFYRDLPLEGSLGVLALGAAGVLAWKRKRQEAGWTPPVPVPDEPVKRKPGTGRKTNG